MTRLAPVLVLALATSVAGCGDDPLPTATSPSVPDDLVGNASRLFTGTLSRGESAFYSLTLAQASGVFVTLASVTGLDSREPTATPLRIGLGVPRGTGCVLSTSVVTAPALTPQLREYASPGVRCVAVEDPASLPSGVRFAVRIGYFQ